jgi:hypothetical protein
MQFNRNCAVVDVQQRYARLTPVWDEDAASEYYLRLWWYTIPLQILRTNSLNEGYSISIIPYVKKYHCLI